MTRERELELELSFKNQLLNEAWVIIGDIVIKWDHADACLCNICKWIRQTEEAMKKGYIEEAADAEK